MKNVRLIHLLPDPFLGDRLAIGAFVGDEFWSCARLERFGVYGKKCVWWAMDLLSSLENGWLPTEELDTLAPGMSIGDPIPLEEPEAFLRDLFRTENA